MQHQQEQGRIIPRTVQDHLAKGRDDGGGRPGSTRKSMNRKYYGYTLEEKGFAPMATAVELILADGDNVGLQYHLITSLIRLDNSGEITFSTSESRFKITGRNLRPIYELLLDHRLIWLECFTGSIDNEPDDMTVIDEIEITEKD